MITPPHTDASFFGMLAVLLVLARVAGHFVGKMGMPSVLGELGVGLLVTGFLGPGAMASSEVLQGFGELGILLLLFEIGLETDPGELRKVGPQALTVALLGMLFPVSLGLGASYLFQNEASFPIHLFTAATLAATSVGLSMRILRDLGFSDSPEARIVLGAAVLDDIFGLVLLTLVTGIAATWSSGATISPTTVTLVILRAVAFIVLAAGVANSLVPLLFQVAGRFIGHGNLLIFGLSLCFAFAYAAELFGLAPIIGAFFAGLVLKQKRYAPIFISGEGSLETQLKGLARVFIPIFFVLSGMHVNLRVFLNPSVLLLALILTVVAVLGKAASGIAAGNRVRRLVIGVAMIPRGEVGLIFASLGLGMQFNGKPLITPGTFGALVGMVMITTLVAPLWLAALLKRPKEAQ